MLDCALGARSANRDHLSILLRYGVLAPVHLGASGVLATVTRALYQLNGLKLISAANTVQGIFFWDFLIT